MNIVLTGFMGTGKSRIGQRLAKKLRMSYLDTDELIAEREKEKIPDIFEKKGEGYFRQLETQVAKEVALLNNYVISTGGGIVLRKEVGDYVNLAWRNLILWSGMRWDPKKFPMILYNSIKYSYNLRNWHLNFNSLMPWKKRLLYFQVKISGKQEQ